MSKESYKSNEMVKVIYDALDDKKGNDITILDIRDVSIIADFFVIADGNNINQVKTMADNVEEKLMEKMHLAPTHIEGHGTASWILMDYNDVIVHVFSKDDRYFYDIERIWADAKEIKIEDID